jgi:hypothetical protein
MGRRTSGQKQPKPQQPLNKIVNLKFEILSRSPYLCDPKAIWTLPEEAR